MFRALLTALSFALLTACGGPEPLPMPEPEADAGQAFEPLLHAHNDYEHPRPLFDALDQRFASVEADVLFKDGDLQVTHQRDEPAKGTLTSLYLAPLAARVQEMGDSVYGDGKPFYLWIDLKEDNAPLRDALLAQLNASGIVSTFDDAGETRRAVTVILTGSASGKEALAALPSPRPFTRDSNMLSDSDPAADSRWGFYALNFLTHVNWYGDGEVPEVERNRFAKLIERAHGKERQIRFWGAPDQATYWQLAVDSRADFIGTDKLAELRTFIDSSKP